MYTIYRDTTAAVIRFAAYLSTGLHDDRRVRIDAPREVKQKKYLQATRRRTVLPSCQHYLIPFRRISTRNQYALF